MPGRPTDFDRAPSGGGADTQGGCVWEGQAYVCPWYLRFSFSVNLKLLLNNKIYFFKKLHNYAFSAMGHSLLPFTEVFGWMPLYGSTGHAINSKARHRPFLFLLPLVRGREILTERLSHTPNGGGGGRQSRMWNRGP